MSALHTSSTPPSSSAWQLIGLSPALGDLTLTVDADLSVGRNAQNDMVLASGQVSRQHARLTIQDGQLWLQDLGSANGTFVNGIRLSSEPIMLQLGDELAFADLAFVVANDDLTDGIDKLEEVLISPDAPSTEIYQPTHRQSTAQDVVLDDAVNNTHKAELDSPVANAPHSISTQAVDTSQPDPSASNLPNTSSPTAATTDTTTDPTSTQSNAPATTLIPNSSNDSTDLAKQGSKYTTVAIAVVVIVALIIIVALFFR